ncbi:hypothetical protein Adt_07703 [Abeliophyllum distichum]|uniref:Uncharacterized protein n=1 Tax=Abeliophyllum distichum TaxID=126358 RepID=A0ABD1VAW0_9LAMI
MNEPENQETSFTAFEKDKENQGLLECLLIIMCEPKLSMEVSKETWSKPKSIAPPVAEKNSEDNPQPRRSSCTLPTTSAASMATMIEQKLVNAVSSYEALVFTGCKSEPMKTDAAKLMPESCFWKNAIGKLEPHRRAIVVGVDSGWSRILSRPNN